MGLIKSISIIVCFLILLASPLRSEASGSKTSFGRKRPAGAIPQSLFIKVAGRPAPREVIIEAALRELKNSLNLEKEGRVFIKEEEIFAPDYLGEGDLGAVGIPLRIYAPNCFPVTFHVIVRVLNEIIKDRPDDLLMISNNPEVLCEPGILFSGVVQEEESARLLFYHAVPRSGTIEASPEGFDLVVTLENGGPSTVEALIIQGLGGPDPDGIYAGHMATLRFLSHLHSGSGYIIEAPSYSTINLFSQRLAPDKEVATGIIKIVHLDGPEFKVQVKALREGEDQKSLPLIAGTAKDNRSCGTFKRHTVEIYKEYRVGDAPLEIPLGLEPQVKSTKGELLIGNYGVFHRLHLKLINPSQESENRVKLIYLSRGGLNRGIFIINDKLYETGLLDAKSKREEELISLNLPPGSVKELTILTMPQPGSYYPASLKIEKVGGVKDET